MGKKYWVFLFFLMMGFSFGQVYAVDATTQKSATSQHQKAKKNKAKKAKKNIQKAKVKSKASSRVSKDKAPKTSKASSPVKVEKVNPTMPNKESVLSKEPKATVKSKLPEKIQEPAPRPVAAPLTKELKSERVSDKETDIELIGMVEPTTVKKESVQAVALWTSIPILRDDSSKKLFSLSSQSVKLKGILVQDGTGKWIIKVKAVEPLGEK